MTPYFGNLGPYGSYAGSLGLYGALVGYGQLNWTETSPPQSWTEPVSVDEAKAHLRLPARSPADTGEDLLISGMIIAAREEAEMRQNRDIVRKQWDYTFDYWPNYRIELRDPLVSVDLIKYRDYNGDYTTLTPESDYIVNTAHHPGIVAPAWAKTWQTFAPYPSGAVLIRFTSGYQPSASPWWTAGPGQRVKIGMLMLINAWFNNRLPYEPGVQHIGEYPMGIESCLGNGCLERVK